MLYFLIISSLKAGKAHEQRNSEDGINKSTGDLELVFVYVHR